MPLPNRTPAARSLLPPDLRAGSSRPVFGRFAAAGGLLLVTALGRPAPADPRAFLDLADHVNRALQDDGIAGNGQGGWTDRGTDDFFVYPPLDFGATDLNGFAFRLIRPSGDLDPSVVVLGGLEQSPECPNAVEIATRGAGGRFLYLLMSASGNRIPRWKVEPGLRVRFDYANGGQTEVTLRQGEDYFDAWSRDQNPPRATRVYTGHNSQTLRGDHQVGLWAVRIDNPRPTEALRSIRLISEGRAAIALFAATLADEDYTARARPLKAVRDYPPDFFEKRLAKPAAELFEIMVAQGHVEGIRSVRPVRDDLICLTIDPAITRTGLETVNPASVHQKPETFIVTSRSDRDFQAGLHPVRVGRRSYETWSGSYPPFGGLAFFWHNFYLVLPRPMKPGHTYTVRVTGDAIDSAFRTEADLAFDPDQCITRAIKVNQAGYAAAPTERFAYLGYWAGDLGAVDYRALTTFRVVDEDSGRTVLVGAITERRLADTQSGEDVYQMDLSALGSGRYHLVVPGLGRSESFRVGGAGSRELYTHTMRAFFHQRCGQELREPWTWARKPACHLEAWESGFLVGESGYAPRPGEARRSFIGGYHDAADYDHFTYHLPSTVQLLDLYELFPDTFRDGDLNLPESGNGIPDILDEAQWGLRFYLENQHPDGSIPLGRGNGSDAFRQILPEIPAGSVPRPPFGVLPVMRGSSFAYAAAAATFARQIRAFDPAIGEAYLQSAKRAYASGVRFLETATFGPTRFEQRQQAAWSQYHAWAAIALYCATGEEAYDRDARRLNQDQAASVSYPNHEFLPVWPYLRTDLPVDQTLRERFRKRLLDKADELVAHSEAVAYRLSCGADRTEGAWGSLNAPYFVDTLIRAHALTGDPRYLNAASANADFQLGANGLGRSFITGMGYDPPRMPEVSGYLYRGIVPTEATGITHGIPRVGQDHEIVRGIPIYGFISGLDAYYPRELPLFYSHRDLWTAAPSSEFTITQTVGPTAFLHGYLHALECALPAPAPTAPAGRD